jgi:hypothetical protein
MRKMLATLVAGLVLTTAALEASAQPVTACGQRVKDGVLVGDLDCGDFEGNAIEVERSLSLAGFTLSGGGTTDENYLVRCVGGAIPEDGNCEVNGPGTLLGTGSVLYSHGIRGNNVVASGVTFEGTLGGVAVIKRAEVRDCIMNGIGGTGVWGRSARVYDSAIIDSGGFGVAASRSAILYRSTVTGSALDGVVSGGGAMLRQSTVSGNATDPAACADHFDVLSCAPPDPTWICADLSARKRLKVRDASLCGTSLVQEGSCGGVWNYRNGETFGVCEQD